MKNKLNLSIAGFVLSIVIIQTSTAFGQGNLTPPGAPGATMITLSQVEPRTPISSAPFTITQPGSYHLTTNIICTVSNAIVIATNGVTLDLGGFTIFSTVPNAANGGAAILLTSGLRDITIANGHIRSGVTNNGSGVYSGSGFSNGIYYSGSQPANVQVSHVSVSGCQVSGLFIGNNDSIVIESCTVRTTGGVGIYGSTVRQSIANDCGGNALVGDQVSDCRGQSVNGYGVYAGAAALNCNGNSANSEGIYCYIAQNCNGYSNGGGIGIYAADNALNCTGGSVTGDGIDAETAQNCYGYTSGNSSGISAVTVQACYGSTYTGYGVYAYTAQDCYGYSNATGYGIYAYDVATGCYGYSYTGTGIIGFLASVCHGATTAGTALNVTHNVNSY